MIVMIEHGLSLNFGSVQFINNSKALFDHTVNVEVFFLLFYFVICISFNKIYLLSRV